MIEAYFFIQKEYLATNLLGKEIQISLTEVLQSWKLFVIHIKDVNGIIHTRRSFIEMASHFSTAEWAKSTILAQMFLVQGREP